MGAYLITDTYLTNTADAIRTKLGTSATITPANFATQIGNISALPASVDLLYDGTRTISSTSTSYANQFSISGTFSNYDAIVMTAIPSASITTANYFVKSAVTLVKTTGSYPSVGGGRYVYVNSSGTVTTGTSSTSGYGLYLYCGTTTLYVRSRCSSSTCTTISGTFHIVIFGISYS